MTVDHQLLTWVLVLSLVIAGVSVFADRFRAPSPILMLLVGAALAFVPGVPAVRLDPEVVLLVLLPPLLYYGGVGMSWRGFRSNLRPILLLAVGGVLVTAVAVAAVLHEFRQVPWTIGLVFGAIVSPPDAVAAIAMLRSVRLPSRIVTILQGEGLANDATALVLLGFALDALFTGHLSPVVASLRFCAIACGEVAFGIALGWLALRARQLARAPRSEVLLALATPFVAFWPAYAAGGSGVIACAATGLYVSWNGRRAIAPATRLQGYFIWDLAVWATESLIFLLGGLQARRVAEAVANVGWIDALLSGTIVVLTVVAIRFLWVYASTYVPRLIPHVSRSEPRPDWRHPFFVAFAGIRGVETLAAALLVPETISGQSFAYGNLILFDAFMVIAVTLVCLGGTLPMLVGALELNRLGRQEAEASRRDEHHVRLQAIDAGLEFLRGAADNCGASAGWLGRYYAERRRALSDGGGATANENPIARAARLERRLLKIEREITSVAYEENRLTDEARRRIERELDLEEARIANREANSRRAS